MEIRAFVAEGTHAGGRRRRRPSDIASFPEVLSARDRDAGAGAQARAVASWASSATCSRRGAARLDRRAAQAGPARSGDGEARGRAREAFSFIDDVRYGEEWIEKLYRLRNIAGIAGLVLGLAFATVS